MNGLPVKDHAIGVLAHQVASDFKRSRGTGFGIVFEHLAPADDSGVGRDLDEDPGVLQYERFDLGDLDLVVRTDGRGIGSFRRKQRIQAVESAGRQRAAKQ